jgi:hypothetical protein
MLSIITIHIRNLHAILVIEAIARMALEPITYELRLQRKAIKEIISSAPEGIEREELARSAELKGIKGDDFEKALAGLLNGGNVFVDKSGKIRYVRNE